MGSTRDIVRRASIAGWIIGAAGLVAIISILLFVWIGQPFGLVNDLARIVMTAAIPFLMLAFWKLGGLTPTPLALVAQASGWLACAAWCVTHLLFVAGAVSIDYSEPATGAFAIEAVALVVIGLWIAGANLLAGPWLPRIRWLGVITGAGLALYAIGTILNGAEGALVYIGGLAYLDLLPVWGLLMGWFLARLGTPGPEGNS